MSPVKRIEGYAERLAILEDLGVQEKALVQDDGLDEVTVANDDQAKKTSMPGRSKNGQKGMLKGQHRKFLMPLPPFLRAIDLGGGERASPWITSFETVTRKSRQQSASSVRHDPSSSPNNQTH